MSSDTALAAEPPTQGQGMSGEPIKPRSGDAVSAQAGRAVPQAGTSTAEDIAARIGASGRGVDFFKSYVSNPAQYGNNVMISYGYLGDENLTKLATFLDASRGGG